MQTVRKVYARLRDELEVDHPFCRIELLTDGSRVFVAKSKNEDDLVDILTRQGVFTDVIKPFLQTVDYDTLKLLAKRWRIEEGIVIDPEICFGAPVVEAAGIPTAILSKALAANGGNEASVAEWYGTTVDAVRRAAAFENKLAA